MQVISRWSKILISTSLSSLISSISFKLLPSSSSLLYIGCSFCIFFAVDNHLFCLLLSMSVAFAATVFQAHVHKSAVISFSIFLSGSCTFSSSLPTLSPTYPSHFIILLFWHINSHVAWSIFIKIFRSSNYVCNRSLI